MARSALPLLLSLLVLAPAARAQQDDITGFRQAAETQAPRGEEAPAEKEEPKAPEPPAPKFGAQGEVVLQGTSSFSVYTQSYDSSAASHLTFGFAPSLDYFVFRNVSVGLVGSVSYRDDQGYDPAGNVIETKSTSIGVAPRLGLNVPLGPLFSWYPRVAFGTTSGHDETTLVSASQRQGATFTPASSSYAGPWISVSAPLLFHPKPHFFLGAGPRIDHNFTHHDGSDAAIGEPTWVVGELYLGGWWGGTPEERSADATSEATPSSARPRRFGDANQWVLTAESGLGVQSTSYSGNGDSSFSTQGEAGFDYFVVDELSLGADIYFNAGQSSGVPSSGIAHHASSSGYGAVLQAGWNVPMGEWLSLYPRAYLGFGGYSSDSVNGSAENQYDSFQGWIALYAPILIHPAPHFFFGMGPDFYREFLNQVSFPNGSGVSNTSSRVGGRLLVGAWL